MNIDIYNSLSSVSDFSNERTTEVIKPLLSNADLVNTFTNLSAQSPLFMKFLGKLQDRIEGGNPEIILKGCESFYKNVATISDELSLILDDAFHSLEDHKLSFLAESNQVEVSSKAIMGSMLFLLLTSNNTTFDCAVKSLSSLERI